MIGALAGAGKPTMIGALAVCYEFAGGRVVGAAPTGRAARQLRDVAGIPAGTMHSLIAELQRTGRFSPRTLLVLDEAGMTPTRLTDELFAHAEAAGVKVIALGDPGQLGSVEAGGWLAAHACRQRGPELREVIRQSDPEERCAFAALHDGQPEVYLARKRSISCGPAANPTIGSPDAQAARQRALERLAELHAQRTLARADPPPFRTPPTRWPRARGPDRSVSLER